MTLTSQQKIECNKAALEWAAKYFLCTRFSWSG